MLFQRCFTDASQMFHQCFTDVSPMFHRSFIDLSLMSHCCFKDVLQMLQRYLNVVSTITTFQGCSNKGNSINGSFMGWCFKDVASAFQECFKNVSLVFHCFLLVFFRLLQGCHGCFIVVLRFFFNGDQF